MEAGEGAGCSRTECRTPQGRRMGAIELGVSKMCSAWVVVYARDKCTSCATGAKFYLDNCQKFDSYTAKLVIDGGILEGEG